MNFPDKINRYVNGLEYTVDSTGKSGAEVLFFDDMVLKIEDDSEQARKIVDMLNWLKGRLPAPEVICSEIHAGRHYLLMSRASGEMLCSEENMRHIESTVGMYAEALKMLWQVDVTGCPAVYNVDDDLKIARERLESGEFDMDDCEPDTFGPNGFASPEQLLLWLEENRPEQGNVLTHGDFCMPNVFVEGGRVSSYIDVGNMGVGDRWRDIALCWRSLKHNCTGMYAKENLGDQSELLFEKLGVEPDWEKIRYYVLLDEFF